jgi:hypothetical protein
MMGGHAFRRQNLKEKIAVVEADTRRAKSKNNKLEEQQAGKVKGKKKR